MAAPGDFFLVVQRNQAFGFFGPGGTIYMYIIYIKKAFYSLVLTHWGRVTHICISKLTIIDSDNGLSPGWRQAIIWTNAGILLIGPLGTNLSEILIEIHTLSCTKMCWKMSLKDGDHFVSPSTLLSSIHLWFILYFVFVELALCAYET